MDSCSSTSTRCEGWALERQLDPVLAHPVQTCQAARDVPSYTLTPAHWQDALECSAHRRLPRCSTCCTSAVPPVGQDPIGLISDPRP